MPTADRAAFVPQAIACFLAQDYAWRQLLVLDSGSESVEYLIPQDSRIHYVRFGRRLKLGELRNRACEMAQGEIIVHWDDDDWYPPNRISRQVARLAAGGAELCGTSRIYFVDSAGARAWEYHSGGSRPWLAGSSFAYWRRLWQRRPFESIQVGEDGRFAAAVSACQVADLADPALVVATVHARNTSPKRPGGSAWRPVAIETVRGLKSAEPTAPKPAQVHPASVPKQATDDGARLKICIGVYARGDAVRLGATLEHLFAQTAATPCDLVVLVDGVDAGLRTFLARSSNLNVSATDEPRGAAACFNRMLRERRAELYVFLESGSLVGPEWLTRLCAALHAHPSHGLAGPTTNMAWSVQGELRGRGATADNVALFARRLAAREGTAWQSLAPLYCLADFCYAVKREVVEAIGAADEGYGLGPCWEMDYTARAVRAGFAAVWARGAYVFRHPFSPQRATEEAAWLPRNKERYQRKFCGQLLRGDRAQAAEHCRGDTCPHFAPPGVLTLHVPLEAAVAVAKEPARRGNADVPLVSCIMPTRGREQWLMQSIRYFERQDYPQRELVIIDDGPTSLAERLPCDPRIRYVHRAGVASIGAKRNLGCEQARGEIIVHWDDDDWYADGRLSAQVAPIVAGDADVTALTDTLFFDLPKQAFWRCAPALYARMFVHAVHGGTLAWAKRLYAAGCRFPATSIAEDAVFLRAALARRARLQALPSDGLFVYVRHGTNAWRFACGASREVGWLPAQPPSEFGRDAGFYAALAAGSMQAA